MVEVLRDSIWQFIGAILALIALMVSILVYRQQRAEKLLVWDARSIVPLLSIHESVEDELQISFRGRAVREAYMASIILENKGNAPISREDFDYAIMITLCDGGEIASLDLANNNIELNGNIVKNNIIFIDEFLLNPGERVTIRSIILNKMPKIDVRARIVGGSVVSVEQFETRASQRIKRVLLGIGSKLLFLIDSIGAVVLALLGSSPKSGEARRQGGDELRKRKR